MEKEQGLFYLRIAKTKALIGCAVTVQLIFALFLHTQKSSFSHDVAHINEIYCNFR